MIILAVFVWSAIGWASLLYDWTRKLDLELSDAVFLFFAGIIIGPFALLIVVLTWFSAIPNRNPIVLIKKRGSN